MSAEAAASAIRQVAHTADLRAIRLSAEARQAAARLQGAEAVTATATREATALLPTAGHHQAVHRPDTQEVPVAIADQVHQVATVVHQVRPEVIGGVAAEVTAEAAHHQEAIAGAVGEVTGVHQARHHHRAAPLPEAIAGAVGEVTGVHQARQEAIAGAVAGATAEVRLQAPVVDTPVPVEVPVVDTPVPVEAPVADTEGNLNQAQLPFTKTRKLLK